MVRKYLLTLKIINLAIFVWLLLIFISSIFNFEAVVTTANNEFVIFAFFRAIRNVFSYIIYSVGLAIGYGCAFITGGLMRNPYLIQFIITFFKKFLLSWFSFDLNYVNQFLDTEITELHELDLNHIPSLLMGEVEILFSDLYLFAFQILFFVSVIYAIRAFIKSDPKRHLVALGSIMMMIVLPLIVFGLKDMLNLFNFQFDYLNQMADPLSPSLFEIPLDNFFQFIASPVIGFAIISYIYLELAFQINYTDTVTKPSLERTDRLEAQLNVLARESHYITANVDQIREEAKKRIEEIELEQKEGLAIGKFFAKTGKRFSYVKEMIEKRKLEEEEKKLVTAASKTRRLGRYIDRLFQEDSEARDTLTASSSAPRAGNLAVSTVVNFIYRVGLLLIISFIIIHPHWFLDTVIQLPDAITESVAMFSPEVIIILLLPIMLIFPVISQLISFVKHRNLIVKLQQEGRIKELLASVGDYVKKEDVTTEEKEQEGPEVVATEST
ncbi:MAG: hypothetical protein KAX18_09720 [Candidatus Lokiarchaeota archaeon]|nr:hypothetical protein [Candidatus Lokiarchaeota archaeon]